MKKKQLIFAMMLLVLSSIAFANVETDLQNGLREQHYESYPDSFTGYVDRFSGDSTSETMAYAAMWECTETGDINLCKDILLWVDENIWQDDNTFAWSFNNQGHFLNGNDGALDGDIPLIWSAAVAYKKTGDVFYLDLYDKWKYNIRDLDTCGDFFASSSGIGRSDSCNSYNGVYPNYIMASLIYDLEQFDPETWSGTHSAAVKQLTDALNSGTFMPNRCGAYDGISFDWNQCEVYGHDPNDAYRFWFWAGLECIERPDSNLCSAVENVVNEVTVNFDVSEGGYDLAGTALGSVQFNEYKLAMWLPSLQFVFGDEAKTYWVDKTTSKWNGVDFWGTSCWGIIGSQNCNDMYQDAWIMNGFKFISGDLSVDLGGFSESEDIEDLVDPVVIPETDYEILYSSCMVQVDNMNSSIVSLTNETAFLESSLSDLEDEVVSLNAELVSEREKVSATKAILISIRDMINSFLEGDI